MPDSEEESDAEDLLMEISEERSTRGRKREREEEEGVEEALPSPPLAKRLRSSSRA